MKIKISIFVLVVIILLFLSSNKEKSIEPQFIQVKKGSIAKIIESSATIESPKEVQISSQITGKIEKIYVKKGQKVKEGQELIQISADDYKSEVQSSTAKSEQIKLNISMIERDLEKSKRDFERSHKLHTSNASTQMEVDDLKTLYLKDLNRLEIAKEQKVEAEAILKKSKVNFENTLIKSPINGIVSLVFLKNGEMTFQGHSNTPGVVIMMLHAENEIVAKCRIDETDIPLVKIGQKAKISLQYDENLQLTGEVIEADIKGFRKQNEPDVSYFETLVKIDNPPKEIKLGMSCSVEILVEEKSNVLLVPLQAVFNKRQGKKYFHYVIDENLQQKEVELGISDESQVEIKGLEENNRILVGPHKLLGELK